MYIYDEPNRASNRMGFHAGAGHELIKLALPSQQRSWTAVFPVRVFSTWVYPARSFRFKGPVWWFYDQNRNWFLKPTMFLMTFRIGFRWPSGLVFGHDAFMLVVSGRGSDASVHDGRFFHVVIYTFFIWCWLCGMMLGTFSSYTQSYPHPIRPATVLHTFLLCLSKVLEDATNNNSQITPSTKLYLIYSVISVACARLVGVRLNHSPQGFVHETLHAGWERSDLSWLGGGFNFLLFSPLVGEDFKFDRYFFKRVDSTTNQMTIDWRASFWMNFGPKLSPFFEIQCLALCQVLPSVGRLGHITWTGFLHRRGNLIRFETHWNIKQLFKKLRRR